MFTDHAGRLSGWLGTASLAAIVAPLILAVLALGPALLTGSVDGGIGRRMWLFDAYLFFAMAAPAVGVVTLASTLWARRTTSDAPALEPALKRARWLGGLALASGALWLFLFPFVFFATGGNR